MNRKPRQVDELLTPDEVCALLKVTKAWLYVQVQRGHISSVRYNGRMLRFKAADIQRYIDRHYEPATAEAAALDRPLRRGDVASPPG